MHVIREQICEDRFKNSARRRVNDVEKLIRTPSPRGRGVGIYMHSIHVHSYN